MAPTNLVTRINLDLIYPPFLERALKLIAKAREQGHDYYAVSGLRSYEEQQKKYNQGRTTGGPRITNAMPGYSMHNYGLAIDVCLDKDLVAYGLQPDWDTRKGQYLPLKTANLDAGWYLQVGVPSIPGGDQGHVQFQCVDAFGMQEPALLFNCRREYLKARDLKRIWKWLDAKLLIP